MRGRIVRSCLLTLATVALCAARAAAATAPGAIVAPISQVRGIADLGRAPATAEVAIAVTLHYRSEAQLEELVELQSNPSSPLYRRFLSNEQFDAAFAPSDADYRRVLTALAGAGFRITSLYSNKTVIDAVGNVASANRFFATDIHRVYQRGHGVRLANAIAARVPAALAPLGSAVNGLSTLTVLRPQYALVRPHPAAVAPFAAGPPLYGPVSDETGAAGYGPLAFSQGYDFPEQHTISGKTFDGTGRVSGVVIDADFLDSDLVKYLAYFKVKRTGPATVRVKVDGGPPSGDGSEDSLETTLDVEALVSNAPGTKLYVYEFPNFDSDQYITDAYNKVVSDNFVDTANSSFGGCETDDEAGVKAWDHIAEQGAAKGITFHASSGDDGADICGTGTNTVSAPADSPHFAAIGGTSLVVGSTGNWESETTWNSDGGASGGGVSKVFALPSWQSSLAGIIKGGRNLPDVSLDADPNTGIALYYGGTWNNEYNPVGGTSLSSPLYGAALTEIDQYNKARAGLAAETETEFFEKNGYTGSKYGTYFHDVLKGCNDIDSSGYCAKKGYDQATGIGSLVWWHYLEETV
jgi:subtilase family serine protease